MKRCNRCIKDVLLEQFSQDKRSADGRAGWCRVCVTAYQREWRAANRERIAAYDRKYYLTHLDQAREKERRQYRLNPQRFQARTRRWEANNRGRLHAARRAYHQVALAIRHGLLVRPSECEWCRASDVRIEAAHSNYDEPLVVLWLCCRCHRRWDHQIPKTRKVA